MTRNDFLAGIYQAAFVSYLGDLTFDGGTPEIAAEAHDAACKAVNAYLTLSCFRMPFDLEDAP